MGICLRYGKNREDAEDIFQEAFVRVFKSIHKIEKTESLDAWVKRIVINTAINYFHKNKKHYGHLNQDFLYENDGYENYKKIIGKLSNEELLELINNLPDGYRMVFNLYVIEGYSHKEIADILKTNSANTKVQLSKAKKALKNMIARLNFVRL